MTMTDLSNSKVTYSFKSDGVDAELDGKVIASGADVAEAETKAHEAMKTASQSETKKVASRKTATRVVTPNGLTGTVLGRTPSIWGEEVTVRFENGHIARLHTSSADLSYSDIEDDITSAPALERIAFETNRSISDDTASLRARLETLSGIRLMASKIASSLKDDDLVLLDGYVSSTRAEEAEIGEVLAGREDQEVEDFTPYRPEARAYEPSWLDRVAAEEVEQEVENFDEKVATFVTALSTDTLADGSLVSQIVYDKVASETDDVEYIENFIEAAEQIRQTEHSARREATKQARIASDQNVNGATDESIFL